ncbi:MAG: transcription-repair coupling factor [Gammaproteobacteria bacterium]|nr:transcription-repair coupling factor [Gammaproteobacteria bacterium]
MPQANTDKYASVLNPPLPAKPGKRHGWGRLRGSSAALAISSAAVQHEGPVMVITPDTLSAQRLIEDIRFYAGKSLPILHFPDWETLPYDWFSPHQDIISERLTALYRLPDIRRGILVLPAATLMQRLPPVEYVQANSLLLERGQRLDRDSLRMRLEMSGYRCVAQVMEHGEFSVRGSLFDLYPMGSEIPYRIDLFDDEIDSLRGFDPETQRSRNTVEQVRMLPAREFPLTKEAVKHFREQWCQRFSGDPMRSPLYQDVSKGLAPAGIEYYLPLFFQHTQTLFDYLPESTLIFTLSEVPEVAERFWKETGERYEQLRHDLERPLLPPSLLFLQTNELFQILGNYPRVNVGREEELTKASNFATLAPPSLAVDARTAHPVAKLKKFLDEFPGRVLIAAETTGRREILLELFKNHGLEAPVLADDWQEFLDSKLKLGMTVAPLEHGVLLESLAVISESQLFGERVAQRRLRKPADRDQDAIIRDLTELAVGAPVVHEEHGVGRYLGLMPLDTGGITKEYLQLEYAKGDKLYVPVTSLHLISRFTGVDPEHAPLHRLGSDKWQKAKRKAAERVCDVAAELLEIHARRAARKGHVFDFDAASYQAFAHAFPFEETPDQQRAIDAVLADMRSPNPMDRLICGDVGFGKTEVAMRAAFVAVYDGAQTAILVPTTLLAQQHYETFQDRFADWPVRIEQLSRFRTGKQQTQILKALREGQVDIIIGTHKLIQNNIKFKHLGLVVIDEEHRFGVRQKERFKLLRAEVDILTLTATPIPRSLNMSLAELRDLSVIATPPSRRLAIKTFVKEWDNPTLAEALLREIKRGGQVYFLHNQIESIARIAREVEALAPEARVKIAHGQMPERELERVMQDFYHRRFNILVCTTIIENGIDVPSANTIIINRADKLGLAQLYQLRGRVGRSHHRAYAYLITPHRKAMTEDAVKRLDAISALEELGVGFTLATHDLEIRGAGELLGDEQSGHMQQIGYSLYTDLLGRAVEALKAGRQPELDRPLEHGAEIDLQVPALLPEDYLPDVHTRLILYKRIAGAPDQNALDEIQTEMIDRFGLLPEAAKVLFKITGLKLKAARLGMRKIELGPEGGRILFVPEPSVDPLNVIQLIQKNPRAYKAGPDNSLRINMRLEDFEARARVLNKLINRLDSGSQ